MVVKTFRQAKRYQVSLPKTKDKHKKKDGTCDEMIEKTIQKINKEIQQHLSTKKGLNYRELSSLSGYDVKTVICAIVALKNEGIIKQYGDHYWLAEQTEQKEIKAMTEHKIELDSKTKAIRINEFSRPLDSYGDGPSHKFNVSQGDTIHIIAKGKEVWELTIKDSSYSRHFSKRVQLRCSNSHNGLLDITDNVSNQVADMIRDGAIEYCRKHNIRLIVNGKEQL